MEKYAMNQERIADTINPFQSLNIISRREVEPLLLKANELLKFYEQASGCLVSVLDQNSHSLEIFRQDKDPAFFCSLCRKYSQDPHRIWDKDEYPCTEMHRDGTLEAQRLGGTYIYICSLGFSYWTSPIYSNGRYVGALAAGRVLAVERQEAIKNIHAVSGGEISEDTAAEFLADIPEKSHEEIKALAQLLVICAERISDGSEDYWETVKRLNSHESHLNTQIRLIKNQHQEKLSSPVYPLDRERILLAALRRGDNETGREILNELLDSILVNNSGNFEFVRVRAIELVVLLSRAAVTPDESEDNKILETNNRYLKRIQEAQTVEKLAETLHIIIERLAGQIFSFQGIRHSSALRKAERFIWENYTHKISLQEIADASGLSAPYFSTIFKNEMGENLSSYLNRLRVGKAATMLAETDLTLNEIAGSCGFEDQSWFSKIFKTYTGISPGKYRERGVNVNSLIGRTADTGTPGD
jgi:AraC-like DNA-binding protein/ligand-binding sensor protein